MIPHSLKTKLIFFSFTLIYLFSNSIAPVLAATSNSYDANGNMTSDGTNCYTYNDSNQLSKVVNCSTGQTIAEYVYDYQGNRIEKKVYTNGSLNKTAYSPSKDYETTKPVSGSTQSISYYYVNDSLLARKNADGTKSYYLTDILNSTTVLTDASGNVIENTSYLPFGQIRSGGTQSKQLYTGQENDSETGLDYYNSRYYNPQLQHFIQPDPIIADVYDPQSLNRYSYVENNPLTHNDPSGHLGIPVNLVPDILVGTAAIMAAYTFEYYTNPYVRNSAAALGTSIVHAVTSFFASTTNSAKSISIATANKPSSTSTNKQNTNNPSRTNMPTGNSPRLPNPFKDAPTSVIVGTITYYAHALDRMDKSDISEERVVEALQNGTRIAGNVANRSVYQLGSSISSSGRGIRVVMDDITNEVVTVTDKGSKFFPK